MVMNPKDAGNQHLGVLLGSIKGPNVIAGDDSSLFKCQKSYFSIVAGDNTLLYRFKVSNLKILPADTLKELRMGVPRKYNWLMERIQ